MAKTTVVRITHPEDGVSVGTLQKLTTMDAAGRAREFCLTLAQYLVALAQGSRTGTVEIQLGGTAAVRSSGYIQIASGTGAVGATIGGTLKTVTWATSDAATIVALIAAINADTTINKKVYATAGTQSNRTSLFSLSPNVLGNITLVASGTGVTVSGATLTGGAGDDVIPVTYTRS